MTNEEAIKGFKMDNLMLQGSNCESVIERNNIAIEALNENTKLKAEIEQLKEEVNANKLWSDVVEKTLKKEIDANAKLREENAELKKLIPRICETCKYEDLMGTEEPCESCNHCSSWKMKIGGRINEQTNRI